ncbi:MAG: c-type cytochrome domain-containing protein, partial [Planctomycetia bacterium]
MKRTVWIPPSPGLRRGLFVVCAVWALPVFAAPAYDREIAPILRTYCSGCHNDRDAESDFSVERFATLRKGGAGSGDPVVPGDAAASILIQRIKSADSDHMPPDDEPRAVAGVVDGGDRAGQVVDREERLGRRGREFPGRDDLDRAAAGHRDPAAVRADGERRDGPRPLRRGQLRHDERLEDR